MTLFDVMRPADEVNRNAMRGPDGEFGRCVLCGRPVSKPGGWLEHKTSDCSLIAPGSEESDGAESQGCFPVGPECAKKPELKGWLIPHER